MLEGAREAGVHAFAFSPDGIRTDKREPSIDGTALGPHGYFRASFALPFVAWNRIPTRRAEHHFRRSIRDLRAWGVEIVPDRFVGKLEVLSRLGRDARAKSLVPPWRRLEVGGVEFLEETVLSGGAFVRPGAGSFGAGAARIVRTGTGFAIERTGTRKEISSIAEVAADLRASVADHLIVQEEVKLLHDDGKPVDFRVHVMRDDEGKWKVVALAGKRAGPLAVTTHLASGGSIVRAEEVAGKASIALLEESALLVAEALEGIFPCPAAEWGVDMGLDRKGRAWVFEANSKPGWHALSEDEVRVVHQTRAMYARFVASKVMDATRCAYVSPSLGNVHGA
jgi:hypothetical protein